MRLLQWLQTYKVIQYSGSGTQSLAVLWHFAALALSLLLLCYVSYRAANLSFVHDESLSFTIIMGDPIYKGTANHHPLNTWLMWVCSSVWG